MVREIYRITAWLPGGSTLNTRYDRQGVDRTGRWEFVGVVANDPIRERYLNGYVGHYFNQGAQNPIIYVNVEAQGQPAS